MVTRNETLKFKMPQYSSTFTGELYAILEALNYILQNKCPQVAIISDSLSAILAIKPIFSQNPIIQRIKKVLHNIKSLKNKVVIVWVPSHIGIPGNELADKTARSAITDPDSKAIKKSVTYDFGTFIKRKVLSTWQNEWSNSGSKLLEIKPSINPWQYWPSSRKSQVILCRLRIGHTKTTHEYLISKSETPKCNICQQTISVKHILIDCPVYNIQRQRSCLRNTLYAILNKHLNVNNLIGFLKDCNLIDQI